MTTLANEHEVAIGSGHAPLTKTLPSSANSYDQVPYSSWPYPQTHPQRMAVIATLLGMRPPPVEHCRVLELGCCTGGNLIPMAEGLPGAQFVGIDASGRQVADGQARINTLGFTNITLSHLDILDVGPELGQFDYIITHGVYSWVPRPVQDKILSICRERLAPNGVAYVSYNTYPGWRMRGIIRDVMLYRSRGFTQPTQRVHHARALVDFLARSVSEENNAYGILLRKELEMLKDKDDHYLYHEHLEECNEPLYFHQFMECASASGLQYLGEADFGIMSTKNLPRQVEAILESVAHDVVEMEQYMDFVRNRMFRQTLLCREEVLVNRTPSFDRLLGMHIATPARPEAPITELKSEEKAVFRGPGGITTTTDPLMKAALHYLSEIWPMSVPFTELLAIARSRLHSVPAVVDTSSASADARRLGDPMIRCYATSQVHLSTLPRHFTLELLDRPCALKFARLQAIESNAVTNAMHETVRLDDLERHVLRLLDGSRNRAELADAIMRQISEGTLLLRHADRAVREKSDSKEIVPHLVEQVLSRLARSAVLSSAG